MEAIITGGVIMGVFTGLVAYVWRDVQKRIEAAMPRELCAERHKALDEKLDEIREDLRWVVRTLRHMNGEADAE
jgi:hypothetical protein